MMDMFEWIMHSHTQTGSAHQVYRGGGGGADSGTNGKGSNNTLFGPWFDHWIIRIKQQLFNRLAYVLKYD